VKTVADFRRAAKEGAVFDMENHRYPELSGRRTVLTAHTNSIEFSFPDGHPRRSATSGSWLNVPKASECTFADGAMTIHAGGSPFVTIRET